MVLPTYPSVAEPVPAPSDELLDDEEIVIGPDPAQSSPAAVSIVGEAHQPPSSIPSGSAVGTSNTTSATITPERALAHDEVVRTRVFLAVCIPLAVVVGICIQFLPVSATKQLLTRAGCGLIVATAFGFLLVIRDESRYSMKRVTIVFELIMLGAVPGVWIIGIYSPSPIVFTFAIYFFGLAGDARATFLLYITSALVHAVPALVYVMGWEEDPGSITLIGFDTTAQLVTILLVQAVYLATFLLARGSRRATKSAIEVLHRALVQMQKQDALLVEAQQDLDRALKGGHKGRYSDRQLGPYVLGAVIGRGAMGEVYRGLAADGGRAAVKVLHPEILAAPEHVRRFLREAEVVSRLRSRHVVDVIAVGTGDQLSGGRQPEMPYIAMELLEGHDLAWHLRRTPRLSSGRVLELVEQVAQALTVAAAAGVVHRDLKPQNVFLTRATEGAAGPRLWKVLDFGVSKLASGGGTLTQGAVIGTPGYMAPEQARGEDVGPTADVFALTAIMYRALVGRPPFSGADIPAILFAVCYQQPQRPSELAPLPEDVERVLAIGMAKASEQRFQSANELAAALRMALEAGLDAGLRSRADLILAALPWRVQVKLEVR